MKCIRIRMWAAGAVAFLLGFPLSEKAFAGVFDVVGSAFDLGFSIADSAGS